MYPVERITRVNVDRLIERLNIVAGRPLGPSTRGDDGHWRASVGHFFLDSMNPGDGRTYALDEYTNEAGGVRRPITERRFKARELYWMLEAAVWGVELGLNHRPPERVRRAALVDALAGLISAVHAEVRRMGDDWQIGDGLSRAWTEASELLQRERQGGGDV